MPFPFFSLQNSAIALTFFAAGVIDSICGGGGLLTVPVMMLTGIPVHMISGTNQCSTTLGNFVSVGKYAHSRIIRYRVAIATIPFAILGAFLGSRLNMIVEDRALEVIMMVLLPLLVVLMLVKRDLGTEDLSKTLSTGTMVLRACLIGLVLGAYQGFYGPGGGMLFLMAFTLFEKMDLLHATGTVRLAGTFASLSATVTYAFSGLVLWQVALPAMVLNILGSYLGSCLAIKNGAKVIRPVMLAVIGLLLANIAVKWL